MTEQPPADMTALPDQLPGGPVATGRDVEQRHVEILKLSRRWSACRWRLSGWMARKGFRTVDELRGLLSVPAGGGEGGYERTGCVTALQAAKSHAGP